ncbi:hypothetical protein B7W85_12850 [Allorhizobium ampelinum]|nr:hypothetical protein B7W85_12850 [Allorhizobium ampelinum]
MNNFQAALALGAGAALIVSLHIPRAWLWIALGVASFVLSTAYARAGLPFPEAFAIACDMVVVLFIYHLGKEKWEMRLWRIFQTMILLNLLYLWGVIGPHSAYIIVLEILNWIALIVIVGTAAVEWARGVAGHFRFDRHRYLRRAYVALRSERAHAAWHKVPK